MDIRQKTKDHLPLIGIFICALLLGIVVTLLALPLLGIALIPKEVGNTEIPNLTQPAEPQNEIGNFSNNYPDLELQESQLKTDTSGNKWIEGVVRNSGNTTYKSIGIKFRLLDTDGKQLGDVIAVSDIIAPGISWDFQATVLDNAAVAFIIRDISAD